MTNSASDLQDEIQLQDQIDRALKASSLYLKICHENGLKVVSWHTFEAWKEYVDGKINESQLSNKARAELEELSKSFGKYVVVDKNDERKHFEEERERLERAKRANKIYRNACAEAGVKVSFFQDFGSWSDFVEGKMSEAEFHEKARLEVEKMLKKLKNAD